MKGMRSAVVLIVFALTGCARWNSESGVENLWRTPDVPEWIVGETTEADVTQILGPPSQLISLQDQTVFYYLREQMKGKGYILLVWNWAENRSTYDRAIFFFDKQGTLSHYAYSPEALTDETD